MVSVVSVSDRAPTTWFWQFDGDREPGRKRLAEECQAVCISEVQRLMGKQALLRALLACEPIQVPVLNHPPIDAWLSYDTHPLVKGRGRWSSIEDGTARIWFCCPQCRRQRLGKLYYYDIPGTDEVSALLCRHCHGLAYLSENCSGNEFYRRVVKPLRRLNRVEELLQGSPRPYKRRALEAERLSLKAYLPDAIKKYGRKSSPLRAANIGSRASPNAGQKRTYKSLEFA